MPFSSSNKALQVKPKKRMKIKGHFVYTMRALKIPDLEPLIWESKGKPDLALNIPRKKGYRPSAYTATEVIEKKWVV